MKFTTTVLCAGAAALVSAAPTATLERRADFCDQWGSTTTGSYTLYNNLWGEDNADSGSQCTGLDSFSDNTLAWHTSWTWSGGSSDVKSFANAYISGDGTALSSISSIETTWDWSYTGDDIVADVAYDIFTGTSASGTSEYEIMIWLAALGGAGPISSTGSAVATVTLAGVSFKLYSGLNGSMTVYSFVAEDEATSFSGDILDFVNYLAENEGFSTSQLLQSIGAGTEPFTGSDAVFTTTAYSVSIA